MPTNYAKMLINHTQSHQVTFKLIAAVMLYISNLNALYGVKLNHGDGLLEFSKKS